MISNHDIEYVLCRYRNAMDRTIDHLLWACRRIPYRFLCDHTNKIAFLYLPKCACSTIQTMITHQSEFSEESNTDRIRGYRRIAIIRHPIDRLLSLYFYWCKGYTRDNIYLDQTVVDWTTRSQLSFDAFFDTIVRRHYNEDVHMDLQTSMISIEEDVEIYRLEDTDRVHALWASIGYDTTTRCNDTSEHDANKAILRASISPDLFHRIHQLYKPDFDLYDNAG